MSHTEIVLKFWVADERTVSSLISNPQAKVHRAAWVDCVFALPGTVLFFFAFFATSEECGVMEYCRDHLARGSSGAAPRHHAPGRSNEMRMPPGRSNEMRKSRTPGAQNPGTQ